jgi:hypothetical protein
MMIADVILIADFMIADIFDGRLQIYFDCR